MPTRNRLLTLAQDSKAARAIASDLPAAETFPLGGTVYTPSSFGALVQQRIDAAHAVGVAKAQWLAAIEAYDQIHATLSPLMLGLKQHVIQRFGPTSPKVVEFGFEPPKRATPTPEEKAAAVVKRNATRKARHTMGKRQKLAIKGDVIGVVVTPVTSPKAEAPAASPAPTAAPPEVAPATPAR